MTSKNKKNDSEYAWAKAKALCDEVQINGDDAKLPMALLARMHSDPAATSQIDSVPGYEDRLVAALMSRAEKEMPQVKTVISHQGQISVAAWYRMASKLIPATAFSFVLVVGLAVVQYMVKGRTHNEPEKGDLWAKAVENAPHSEVSRWMASVSDHGTQTWDTSSDIDILSATLNEVQLKRVLKEDGGS